MGLEKYKQFFTLLFIRGCTAKYNSIECLRVLLRYYKNLSFAKSDLILLWSYLFSSPFAISKQYLIDQEAQDIYTYGQTPLTSLEIIAKEMQLNADDVVFDLGCGTGRTSLWLHHFIGCKVVGIERIVNFVQRAQSIADSQQLQNITFQQQDILQVDYRAATALYLYGTCFDESFIHMFIRALRTLPQGAKILTVSYALQHYTQDNAFPIIKQFPISFPWGTADVYLQHKKILSIN